MIMRCMEEILIMRCMEKVMCMDVNDDDIGSCFMRVREGKAIHQINIQNEKSSNKVITKIGKQTHKEYGAEKS